MAQQIQKYLSLVTFSHTVFALPFAIIGFFLGVKSGQGQFTLQLFLLVIMCMVFARSAAMAFNRYIDRNFDKLNIRTATREIPSNQIKPLSALIFVLLNCMLFWICTWFINPICFKLAPIALAVILGYSYTKRYTAICHLVLGVGLALAPIGAYLAVTGKFDLLPLLFSFAVFCWVSGFDIIYALQDIEFDRSQKLKSIPVMLGEVRALQVSQTLHFLTAVFLIYAGLLGHFGSIYFSGVVLFICALIYQHRLVSPTDLSKVDRAFFTTNGIASVGFALFVLAELFL